jgi:hypothetical protein
VLGFLFVCFLFCCCCCVGFFEIGSRELFAQVGSEP